jgi:hypothetical protein
VLRNSQLPRDVPPGETDGGTAASAAAIRPGQCLIAIMLLAAAALDLTRCGLVLVAARHPMQAAGLVAAGLAATALSVTAARGCQARRRWAGWAALLIGTMSAPQAAASGFHAPYTIPDTATAALGIVLAVAVLATAGPTRLAGHDAESSCVIDTEPPVDQQSSRARPSPRSTGNHPPHPGLRRAVHCPEPTATPHPPRPR